MICRSSRLAPLPGWINIHLWDALHSVAMEIELRRLIGHRVIVMGPNFVDNEKLQSVKLLAIEEAGIWIESQEAVIRGPRLFHSLWTDYVDRGGLRTSRP